MSRHSSHRLRLLLLLACIWTLALSTNATAGTVRVTPDFVAGSTSFTNGWWNGISGYNLYLGPTNPASQEVKSPGTEMWVRTPALPANVSISEAFYTYRRFAPSDARPFQMAYCLSMVGPTTSCARVDALRWPGSSGGIETGSGGLVGVGYPHPVKALQLEIVNPAGNTGFFEYTSTSVNLIDSAAPSVTPGTGNAFTSGKWLSGSVSLPLSATDTAGVGVKTLLYKVESVERARKTATCNYATWLPCAATDSWSPSFDTTTMDDGRHTASFEAADAANNSTSSPVYDIKIDNTAPAAPEDTEVATEDGMKGSTTINSFDVSWRNIGETVETTNESGIAKVVVDLDPVSGGVDPAAVTVPVGETVDGISATIDTLSGVTLPEEGQFYLRLRTLDAAGNKSPWNDGGDDAGNGKDPERIVPITWDTKAPPKAEGWANGWVSRSELENGTAVQRWNPPTSPGEGESPVCGWGLSASSNQFDEGRTVIDVYEPATTWTLPATLPEGTSWIHIRAIKCNGIPAEVTDHQSVQVDLTDPTASFSGVEEGKWYKDGLIITLRGADTFSGMEPAPPEESSSTAGAYIGYTVNGVGPAAEDSPRGGEAQITVSGEGAKLLRFWPVDVAGNAPKATEVRFGIDATAPVGHLAAQDPTKPTVISAPVSDVTSGLAGAVISVRNLAGGPWKALPTALSSFSGGAVGEFPVAAVATARFPDVELPKGSYEVRVQVTDQAGNVFTTDKRADGTKHVLANPMRAEANLTGQLWRALRKCKRSVKVKGKTKKTKCVKKKKGKVYLDGGKNSITVGYRRAGVLQGFLTSKSYKALKSQPIEIWSRVQGGKEVLEGETSTRADGYWYYRLKPGVSRQVRIVYPGTELIRSTETKANFRTSGKVTLKFNKKKVRSGQRVNFTGKVTSFDKIFPARGKIVVLQFYSAGKWRPAVTISRTNKKGTFKGSYRFTRTKSATRAKIKFRLYAPAELDFHHASSASRHRVVKLNWR